MSISSINELSSFQDINGVTTHLLERGEGSPLILIHGFMGACCDWRFNILELARHFSVKAFDLPGFGYSNKPLDFSYTGDGYASFIIALLDKLNIERATLAGNSLGGELALNVCLKYPDRVSALVLVDSGGYPACVKFPLFKLLKIRVLGEALMSLTSPLSVRYVLGHILKDKTSIQDDVVSYYHNVFKTANARAVPTAVIRNMAYDEIQLPGRLGEINCPALIIWGAQDEVIPFRYARMFNQAIKNSRLFIIDNAGHLPQLDQPDIFNRAVIDFLRE